MLTFEMVLAMLLFILATVCVWLYIHQLFFFIIAIYTARFRMNRGVSKLLQSPGVSIIKPLMGCDPLLRDNLVSHFTLNYPKFEILFCVHDANDPVVELVNSLRLEYPMVDCQLLSGGVPGTINPMVDNMAPAYAAAKYDLIWVSTSRIQVSTPIMLDMVDKSSNPDVALVHQPSFSIDQPGFYGALEKVSFGCSIMRNQLALNQLGVLCFIGMSYIVKKSMLDELGGLEYYGKYLAEDFFFSSDLRSRGYRAVLSNYPAMQAVSGLSYRAYINRVVRWLRLRLCMIPVVAGIIEPMNEGLTIGLLMSWAINYLFDLPFYCLFIAHLLIWIPLDYILLLSVQKSPLPFSFLMFLMAWFCRELSVYLVFISALSNPTHIKWGRHMYKVHFGGLTTRLTSNHRSTIKHDHRDDSDEPKSTTWLVNDYASSDSTSLRLSTPSTMIHL